MPTREWIERYLAFLQVDREPPSPDALARLTRAQIESTVFENVTAILRRAAVASGPVPAPDPDELLDAWIERRGGGVCFELAPMFRRLLRGLGYAVTPLLAQISFPGSHHATLVEVDGRAYLVDVGGGWPLWQPVAIGATQESEHAGLGFRLRPDGEHTYVQERRDGADWAASCWYDLRSADAPTRDAAYQRHQLACETWVVGDLTLIRSTADGVVRLRDDELVRHSPHGKRSERLQSDADYRAIARDLFGLPGLAVDEARGALTAIKAGQSR
jgi:arylamine N-acetyltransferase